MIKIAHIINPVKVPESSDLYTAQPITFETMRIAREYAEGIVDVTHFSAQFSEDREIVPSFIKKTTDLNRSVLDIGNFNIKRKLPVLKDILDRLYDASDADYLIYTNCDIALMPYFYVTVKNIINNGHDAFVINRRTISNQYGKPEEIPLMWAEKGEKHRGFDCFVFKRELYPQMELGDLCIGALAVGRALIWNLVSVSRKFQEFKDLHMTFHLGNDRKWKKMEFDEYRQYNRKGAHQVLKKIFDKFGSLEKIKIRGYLGRFSIDHALDAPRHISQSDPPKPFMFIFIVGLHRSGTTVITDCLKNHPLISGFSDTGFPKDEGQFLQSVFPLAREFGGPGKFGFSRETHLTESSKLLTSENKAKLFDQWSRHWDSKKPLLLEKSPPNLLKTRFLQAVFPNSYFIFIIRHPIPTSYATRKWSKTSIPALLKHWYTCHRIFFQDAPHLHRLLTVKYEDFCCHPESELERIYKFLGIPDHHPPVEVRRDINKSYFQNWHREYFSSHPLKQKLQKLRFRGIEKKMNKMGYSLFE